MKKKPSNGTTIKRLQDATIALGELARITREDLQEIWGLMLAMYSKLSVHFPGDFPPAETKEKQTNKQ